MVANPNAGVNALPSYDPCTVPEISGSPAGELLLLHPIASNRSAHLDIHRFSHAVVSSRARSSPPAAQPATATGPRCRLHMDDIDLRNARGRLIKLAISAAIALVVTVVVMHVITAWSRPPNSDPVGAATVPLLAIGVFVVTTAFVRGLMKR